MTDRHAGYLVVLERDLREDDAAAVLSALSLVKGVAEVVPVRGSIPIQIATERVRRELLSEIEAMILGRFK